MNSPKTYLIILLALTTLGGAALAWRQYQELTLLRAAATSGDERADLQKKIWDLQKANRALQDQLAALRAEHENGDEMAADAPGDRPPGPDTRGPRGARGRGQQFAAMRELMAKPEVQALMSSAQKAMVDGRYAALFRTLNLSPDQADKLKALLVERQNSFQDVLAAARDQGVDPRTDREGFQKLLTDAQNSVNDSIKSLIGDSGFNQLQNYDQTMPQRNLVNALQQRLSGTDTPLSSAQADQLVAILAANSPQRNTGTADGSAPARGGGDFGGGMMRGGMAVAFGGGGLGGIMGPGAAPITTEAINAATSQNVLSPAQASALQQLQQQQQITQQLQQAMRSAWQQSNTGTTAGATPGTGASTGSTTGGTRRGGG